MRLVRIAAAAFIALLLGQGAYAQLLLPETEYSIEARKVLKERLGRIGLVVQRASGGQSRLLLSSGEGAYCTLGMVVHRINWGDVPPVMAFRVSEPVGADLQGIGECRLLGALFLHEDATIVGGQKITSGVYLLAYSSDAKKVLAIEIKVEGGGRVAYRELGRVPLENPDISRGSPNPYVGVWFPTEELLADDNPSNRATIDLAWKRESYMFRPVDVDFMMI
jgi:hypothetical protein